MADKKADIKKQQKDAEKHSLDIAEKGYDEDALTEEQKAALDHEEEFMEASKELQESDDPDDMREKRQQV